MRVPNSITNQFEKPGVDDFLCRKFIAITGALIGHDQCSTIGILVCAMTDIAGVDADIVASHIRYERSLCRYRPTFDVRFEEIRILADEFGCAFVASIADKLGRAYQRRNVDGQ